jgi:hypothetical protein
MNKGLGLVLAGGGLLEIIDKYIDLNSVSRN